MRRSWGPCASTVLLAVGHRMPSTGEVVDPPFEVAQRSGTTRTSSPASTTSSAARASSPTAVQRCALSTAPTARTSHAVTR